MNRRITAFVKNNTNLTLATCLHNIPYCANCFYVFDEKNFKLVIKSSRKTKHINNALENSCVAGSITPDKLNTSAIKGIQFEGLFSPPQNNELKQLETLYYSKYPFARIVPGELWEIGLRWIKMTDNTLGFGSKIEWSSKDKSLEQDHGKI